MDDNVTISEFVNIALGIVGFVVSGYFICYFYEKRDRKEKAERFNPDYME